MANYSPTMEEIKLLRAKTSAGISLCKEALIESGGDMDKAVEYINKKSDVISRLHNLTGAKIGLCKIALTDAEQNFEKAVEIINEKGWADALSVGQEKVVKEGIIEAYVHSTDHKTVSLVEITCLTDFVAKNEDFRAFAHEIAMQAVAMNSKYVTKESIPSEVLEETKLLFERETKEEGKPENIIPKIVEGKLAKFYQENCLMEQKWFKDESKTIRNLLDEIIGKLGESITIRRVLVWKFGE